MQKDPTSAGAQQRLYSAEDVLQMVSFVVSGEHFGVDILTVKEIIKNAAVTAIPDAPAFILGVINLRGSIIPVIDLRKRLNFPAATQAEGTDLWIIILDIGGRITGFKVDRVTRVVKVAESDVKPPPDLIVAGSGSYYVSGVVNSDEQLLAILDFNRVLAVDEFKKISLFKRQQGSPDRSLSMKSTG